MQAEKWNCKKESKLSARNKKQNTLAEMKNAFEGLIHSFE